MNTIMVIGHPGHELRAYHWMVLNAPTVFVLTDGSGSSSEGRIESTRKVVEAAGAHCGEIFGAIKDELLYRDIINKDASRLAGVLFGIYQAVIDEGEREVVIAGDGMEGYNTAHDITRYMINILAARLRVEGFTVHNYAFNLIDDPSKAAADSRDGDIVLRLNDDEFEQKHSAARNYPELAKEVENAIANVGRDAFKSEVLYAVSEQADLILKPLGEIYYEIYGQERVKEGKYKELIEFDSHMLPFSESLERQFHNL